MGLRHQVSIPSENIEAFESLQLKQCSRYITNKLGNQVIMRVRDMVKLINCIQDSSAFIRSQIGSYQIQYILRQNIGLKWE